MLQGVVLLINKTGKTSNSALYIPYVTPSHDHCHHHGHIHDHGHVTFELKKILSQLFIAFDIWPTNV